MTRQVALIGGAMSPLSKYVTEPAMHVAYKTIRDAIADSGIDRSDIQGLAVTPPGMAAHGTAMFVSRLGEHLGMDLRSLTSVENGGCSSALALRWAINEVSLGRCKAIAVLGIDQRFQEFPEAGEDFPSFINRMMFNTMSVYGAYDGPFGLGAPIPYYAMAAQRYLYEYDATSEDLAWAAVRLREHAQNNPSAMFYGKPLSVEEVLDSKYLSPPLHLTDCSQFVTGAAAVIVADADFAKSAGCNSVLLKGWGQYHHASAFSTSADSLITSPAVRGAADEAFTEAGVGPQDIDVAEVYGVFSSTELILCEDLGFFERGQAGRAFKEGRATYGGDLVVDPSGGRLSLGHPACATPIMETLEICHQLQGRAEGRQVEDATLGLMHAEHGMLNGSVVSIWERAS
jgi:acetyl-CoA C-acetyltransferase